MARAVRTPIDELVVDLCFQVPLVERGTIGVRRPGIVGDVARIGLTSRTIVPGPLNLNPVDMPGLSDERCGIARGQAHQVGPCRIVDNVGVIADREVLAATHRVEKPCERDAELRGVPGTAVLEVGEGAWQAALSRNVVAHPPDTLALIAEVDSCESVPTSMPAVRRGRREARRRRGGRRRQRVLPDKRRQSRARHGADVVGVPRGIRGVGGGIAIEDPQVDGVAVAHNPVAVGVVRAVRTPIDERVVDLYLKVPLVQGGTVRVRRPPVLGNVLRVGLASGSVVPGTFNVDPIDISRFRDERRGIAGRKADQVRSRRIGHGERVVADH